MLWNLEKSLKLLEKWHVPVAKWEVVSNEAAAAAAAKRLGFPLVAKINSGEHKSKTGGVILDIHTTAEASAAYKKLSKKTKSVVFQKMEKGVEVIVGMKRDPTFGPVVLFGLGGVMVEVLKEVNFALAPLDSAKADQLIQTTRGAAALKGKDVAGLRRLLVNVSKGAVRAKISELDVNPVMVGTTAVAVDGRVVS